MARPIDHERSLQWLQETAESPKTLVADTTSVDSVYMRHTVGIYTVGFSIPRSVEYNLLGKRSTNHPTLEILATSFHWYRV